MNQKPKVEYLFRCGEVFGRLQLTGYSYREEYKGYVRRFVEAKCECGDIDVYVFDNIQSGSTRSCGCLQKDLLRLHPHRITHGLSKHPLFKIWDGMKGRCYDKKNISYPDYGAKGIKICEEWLKDFKAFYDWCLDNGWEEGLTIDRKRNDEDYGPDNCRWVSTKAQRMNRDDIHLFTAFGESKCAKDWSLDERCKVSYGGLRNRLYRDKEYWPDIEKAITTPPGIRGMNKDNKADVRTIFAFGEEKTVAEWLKDERCKCDETRLRLRLRKQWSPEEAISTYQRQLPTKIKTLSLQLLSEPVG